MTEFLMELSLFPLVLTIGTYQIGRWCQKKWNHPVCNPILIAIVLILPFLLFTGFSVEVYQAGIDQFSWLLSPATVCLALPLYRQVKILRKNLGGILIGILSGTATSLLFILGMCHLFSLDAQLSISLLPKSITTAIGLPVSQQNGGIPALTAFAIFFTGVLGGVLGPILCKWFKIQHPIAQGVAFGTASHVIGTTKATELGDLQGAVSSLSLAVAGIVTAVIFPLVCQWV